MHCIELYLSISIAILTAYSLAEALLTTAIDAVSELTRQRATSNCTWKTCTYYAHDSLRRPSA